MQKRFKRAIQKLLSQQSDGVINKILYKLASVVKLVFDGHS